MNRSYIFLIEIYVGILIRTENKLKQMNYYLLFIFISLTIFIYSLKLPVRKASRTRLGAAVGMSAFLTSVLHLTWIVMSWIILSLYSLFTGLF